MASPQNNKFNNNQPVFLYVLAADPPYPYYQGPQIEKRTHTYTPVSKVNIKPFA